MTNKYVVIIKKEKRYNVITCPEIGLIIKSKEESLTFIEQEISNHLVDKILKNEKVPEGVTELRVPKALKAETIFIVSIDLELEIVKRKNKFVKKTLTIPEYLNILGMRKDLNFSQILAEGLREKLKVK